MSSALAVVLAAAMVLPANGPERVSGEVERGLDLRDRWESNEESSIGGPWWVIENGKLQLSRNVGFGTPWECRIVDEGRGKFKMTRNWDGLVYLGIYRQEGERLILCFRAAAFGGRPVEYRENGWAELTELIILHRIKPRK